jgi:hypothetical protein
MSSINKHIKEFREEVVKQRFGVPEMVWTEALIKFWEAKLQDVQKETERSTQRKIFKALDKLEMPPALMVLVKDTVGVTTEEMTGLDAFVAPQDSKEECKCVCHCDEHDHCYHEPTCIHCTQEGDKA